MKIYPANWETSAGKSDYMGSNASKDRETSAGII